MENYYGLAFAILEMTFLLVMLLFLHSISKKTGVLPLYLSLGVIFAFMQIIGATDLVIETNYLGSDAHVSSSILLLPFLSIMVVIYIIEGTTATHGLILGLIFSLVIFLYLGIITKEQIDVILYHHPENTFLPTLSLMMGNAITLMAANIVSFSFDIFLLPIFYQWLRNLQINLGLCITGALLCVTQIDSLIFAAVSKWGDSNWWLKIENSYLFNFIMTIWLSLIITFYISKAQKNKIQEKRGALDIIFSFFDFNKNIKLRDSLRVFEERYEVLFRNTLTNILLVTEDGIIAEVNPATLATFQMRSDEIIGHSFIELTGVSFEIWSKIISSEILNYSTVLPSNGRFLEMTLNVTYIDDKKIVQAFCVDQTEKIKMENQHQSWQEKMYHRERLASIGELAGGIAHDFNNFLYTIQGHLDNILFFYPVHDSNAERHLNSINQAIQKASSLTKDLLGFARKGKYHVIEIYLEKFVEEVSSMFQTGATALDFQIRFVSQKEILGKIKIMGDSLQLHQVIMNILMNAKDAVKKLPETERQIILSFGLAKDASIPIKPPLDTEFDYQKQYAVISIWDNGPGIPSDVVPKIFEPFFTTKPVGEGTGMGLSMAYGIMLSHKGWIQLDQGRNSKKGCTFTCFFPVVNEEEQFL